MLIRALEMIEQGRTLLRIASGPGKVSRFLKLDGSLYGEDLQKSKRIWVENSGIKVSRGNIVTTKRIGIDYAQDWKDKPLRFYIKGNKSISRP